MTDGNVFVQEKRQGLISLSLKQSDSYMVQAFRDAIGSNKKLVVRKEDKECSVQILSDHMTNTLIKYGVIPRKSGYETIPEFLEGDMLRHFLRGVFDGDGSPGFYNRPNRTAHRRYIAFCSASHTMIEQIVSSMRQEIDVDPVKISNEHGVFIVRYVKNESVEKIINYLYKDATIYLTRKKETCDKITSEIRQYRDNREG